MTYQSAQKMTHELRRSRRSRFIALAISAVIPLAACTPNDGNSGEDSIPENDMLILKNFSSVDDCVRSEVYTAAFCQKADREARNKHARLSARYDRDEDCKKDWEACDEAHDESAFEGRKERGDAPEEHADAVAEAAPTTSSPASSPPPAASAASQLHGGGGAHPVGTGGGHYYASSSGRAYYTPRYSGFSVGTENVSEGQASKMHVSPMMRTAGGDTVTLSGIHGVSVSEPQISRTSMAIEPTAPESFRAGQTIETVHPTSLAEGPSVHSEGVSAHGESGAHVAPSRAGISARSGFGARGFGLGAGG